MPSPFPGMDPYLEDPIEWPGVHTNLIVAIQELLAPQLAPHYVVRIEQRVHISSPEDPRRRATVPDVYVAEQPQLGEHSATATLISPSPRIEPLYDSEMRTRFLEVRDARGRELVATLELLSPANKAADSPGRAQYLDKRKKILCSGTHWIEIDLLRAGERPDRLDGQSDYYALLNRGDGYGPFEVWFTDLRDRLPVIAVPLRPPHDDVPLDLQAALDTIYERAYFADSIDYSRPVPSPQLLPADANWVAARIHEWQQNRAAHESP
jgi:hypothetical protein